METMNTFRSTATTNRSIQRRYRSEVKGRILRSLYYALLTLFVLCIKESSSQSTTAANQFSPLLYISNDVAPYAIPTFELYIYPTTLSSEGNSTTISKESQEIIRKATSDYLNECFEDTFEYNFAELRLDIMSSKTVVKGVRMEENNSGMTQSDNLFLHTRRMEGDVNDTNEVVVSGTCIEMNGTVSYNFDPFLLADDDNIEEEIITKTILEHLNDSSKNKQLVGSIVTDAMMQGAGNEIGMVSNVVASSPESGTAGVDEKLVRPYVAPEEESDIDIHVFENVTTIVPDTETTQSSSSIPPSSSNNMDASSPTVAATASIKDKPETATAYDSYDGSSKVDDDNAPENTSIQNSHHRTLLIAAFVIFGIAILSLVTIFLILRVRYRRQYMYTSTTRFSHSLALQDDATGRAAIATTSRPDPTSKRYVEVHSDSVLPLSYASAQNQSENIAAASPTSSDSIPSPRLNSSYQTSDDIEEAINESSSIVTSFLNCDGRHSPLISFDEHLNSSSGSYSSHSISLDSPDDSVASPIKAEVGEEKEEQQCTGQSSSEIDETSLSNFTTDSMIYGDLHGSNNDVKVDSSPTPRASGTATSLNCDYNADNNHRLLNHQVCNPRQQFFPVTNNDDSKLSPKRRHCISPNSQKITVDDFNENWNEDLPYTWDPTTHNNAPLISKEVIVPTAASHMVLPGGHTAATTTTNSSIISHLSTITSTDAISMHRLPIEEAQGAFPRSPTKSILLPDVFGKSNSYVSIASSNAMHPLDWSIKSAVLSSDVFLEEEHTEDDHASAYLPASKTTSLVATTAAAAHASYSPKGTNDTAISSSQAVRHMKQGSTLPQPPVAQYRQQQEERDDDPELRKIASTDQMMIASPLLPAQNTNGGNTSSEYYPSSVGGTYLGEICDEEDDHEYRTYPHRLNNKNHPDYDDDEGDDDDDDYEDEEEETSSRDESRQFINDLVWLEKRISETRAAAAASVQNNARTIPYNNNTATITTPLSVNTSNIYRQEDIEEQQSSSNPNSTTSNYNNYSNTPQSLISPIQENISYRDIFAPPGHLNIIIQSTMDGPSIHAVSIGSALEGVLFPGDLIVAVDNVDTRSMTADRVTLFLRERTDFVRKFTVFHFDE